MTDLEALWQRLGAAVPLVSAPMGGVAGGRLASAVSRTGALGMIGMGSAGSPDALRRELALLDTGGAPFGIGLVDWVTRQHPTLIDDALDAAPALLSVSFGEFPLAHGSRAWIAEAQQRGIVTAAQVASVEEARRAQNAGVEVLVARGLEAGGHGAPERELTPLLAEVLAAVDRPVLAAGAIATGDDLLRVLDAGAAGAWVGTAFAAAPEALTNDRARSVLLTADGSDTIVTREVDLRLGYPWPERFPERIVRGTEINAGMGVGELTRARPAAETVAAFRAALSERQRRDR